MTSRYKKEIKVKVRYYLKKKIKNRRSRLSL